MQIDNDNDNDSNSIILGEKKKPSISPDCFLTIQEQCCLNAFSIILYGWG